MKLTIEGNEYYVDFIHEPWRTTPYGTGETWCSLRKDANSEPIVNGVAYCGKKDKYSKRKGRKTSFAWMLEEFGVARENRGVWWEQYFKQLPNDRAV